jgi:hypothetical protein
MAGYALNIAIGLQVVVGALTTGLSVVTSGKQTQIMTAILGGIATIIAAFLARARGSGEPERSSMRARDLEQFVREAESFVMDRGYMISDGAGGPAPPGDQAGQGAMQGGAISAGGGGMAPWIGGRDPQPGAPGGGAPGEHQDEKAGMQQQPGQPQGAPGTQRTSATLAPGQQQTSTQVQVFGPSGGAPGAGAAQAIAPTDDEHRLMQFRARFEELLGASNGERRPVGGV